MVTFPLPRYTRTSLIIKCRYKLLLGLERYYVACAYKIYMQISKAKAFIPYVLYQRLVRVVHIMTSFYLMALNVFKLQALTTKFPYWTYQRTNIFYITHLVTEKTIVLQHTIAKWKNKKKVIRLPFNYLIKKRVKNFFIRTN